MDPSKYMIGLRQHLLQRFMPGLRNREASVLDALQRCRCIVTSDDPGGPTVEFALPDLMNALWRHGLQSELDLPSHSAWNKDFDEFCNVLLNPWPTAEFARAGYVVKPVVIKRRRLDCRYRFLPASEGRI